MPEGCSTCGVVLSCGFTDDADLFSLQSQTFPFVLNCPEGYDCNGVSSFTLLCCGQSIGEVFPTSASLADRLAIIQRVVQRCFVAQLSCAGSPPIPPPLGSNPSGVPAAPAPAVFSLFYNEPQTATVKCPDGTDFSYTAQAGITGAGTLALANKYALEFAKLQADAKRICLGAIPEIICFDVERTIYVPAQGGGLQTPPDQNFWEIVAGSVPTGMTFAGGYLTGATGTTARATISGTPSVGGEFDFTARIVGREGVSKVRAYSLCVMEITPSTLPAVTVGDPYSQQLSVPACASPAIFAIIAGTLPAGLSMSTSGLISGTPTEEPSEAITVRATTINDAGAAVECDREIEFTPSYSPPEASYWWKMEESGADDRLDAVEGVPILVSASTNYTGPPGPPPPPAGGDYATVQSTAGKVGTALNFTLGSVGPLYGSPTGAMNYMLGAPELTFDGGEFSFIVWIKVEADEGELSLSLTLNQIGPDFANIYINQTTVMFSCGGVDVTVPTANDGLWHFYRCQHTPGQNLKLYIDNGAANESASPPVSPGAGVGGVGGVVLLSGTVVGTADVSIDELGFFNVALTDDDGDFFWNGGSGVTYPYL